MAFQLTSPAFQSGEAIPSKYTCDGANVSPPLTWNQLPKNAQSLALIMDDPDAPKGTWTHWVVYNLAPTLESLPEDFPASNPNAMQALNSYQHARYEGPCPPGNAQHTYHFRLYALDQVIEVRPGATYEQVVGAMRGHIVASVELTATYARQGAKTVR